MLSQVLLFIPFLFTAHQYGIHSTCPSIYLSILSAVVPRYSSLHLEGFIFPGFCLLLLIFWLFLIFFFHKCFQSLCAFFLLDSTSRNICTCTPSTLSLESLVPVLFLWCYQPATWYRMTNCPNLPCTKILGPRSTRMADHCTYPVTWGNNTLIGMEGRVTAFGSTLLGYYILKLVIVGRECKYK